MAQYWDATNGVWRDDSYPDIWMKPSDQGGDGLWHNPQGLVSDGGAWMTPQQYQQLRITPQQQQATTAALFASGQNPQQINFTTGQPNTVLPSNYSSAQPVSAPGAYQNVPGYGYALNQQQYQNTYDLNAQTQGYAQQNQAAQTQASIQLEQMREASAQNLQNLQNQMNLEIAKGNNANALAIAQMQNAIDQERNRLQALQVQINQAAEARQERELQAQLAANPQDFVAYEYYKRALGNPSTLGAVNGSISGSGNPSANPSTPISGGIGSPSNPVTNPNGSGVYDPTTGAQQTGVSQAGGTDNSWLKWAAANPQLTGYNAQTGGFDSSTQAGSPQNTPTNGVATPQTTTSPGQMLNGQSYSPAPPAYSDNTLANVINGIQNQTPAQWNPNLSGAGVFGSTINPPNELGRAQYGNLSDTDKGILTSALNAGINMNGRQVSLDPNEYFQQMQRSWVPTLNDITGGTQYK